MSIKDRYNRLLQRRAPAEDRVLDKFAESYERERGDHTRYILGAMRAVDAKYTERLSKQGDRVENQLGKRLEAEYPTLEFRRQGSVSNDTHIRYFSDIDVLTIIDKFVMLERPQEPTNPYKGEPLDDLNILRQRCVQELDQAFPKVRVDDSSSTAVKLSGGSLVCDVDVVPANWFNTNDYARTEAEYTRGVQVLDREKRELIKNFPFLFNYRLEVNDRQRFGLTRMLIRLLKTVKADLEEDGTCIDFSSFDVCSLVYRMPDQYIVQRLHLPLDILDRFLQWMRSSITEDSIRSKVLVIDDSRRIFDSEDKKSGAKLLFNALHEIYQGALCEQGGRVLLSESHLR